MEDADFSAIGTDAPTASPPSDLAKKEDWSFAIEKMKEDHDHALKIRQHELGAIGRIFGNRDNAITYVIAFLVAVSIVMLGVFSFIDTKGTPQAVEFFKTIALAGFGYLTGKTVEIKNA